MLYSSESEDVECFDKMTENDIGKQKEELCEVTVPTIGLELNNLDKVYAVCLAYSRKEGFSLRKRSTKREEGVVRYVTLTCAKSGTTKSVGSNPIEQQPSSRNGCKAKICSKLNERGKYEITSVILEHNHILSPGKVRHFRCNRKINAHVARQLEISDMAGIKVSRNYKQHVVAAGGHENVPFNERDYRNYIQKKRSIRLGEGDALAIQQYFLTMQKKSNGFIFSMDLDEDGCLRNVFWADRRSREAYKEFGDVVTFDTTYLTNRYGLPFAPFVGINHHGQSILLGCGLLSNEDTETFSWLFRTWLDCMDGKAPDGIITDQDQAMRCAIEEVFPNTRHRWCLWHIMKKIPQKLSSYKDYKKINTALHDIVYDTLSIEEFECKWRYMIDHYSLRDNRWLDDMYRERKRWVPIFVKPYFWAGMSSTQRSESMNAFFDGYVNVKTSLKVLVEQYNVALRDKVEKEAREDFRTYHFELPCVTPFEIERQMRDIYTLAKFQDFRSELTGKLACDYVEVKEYGTMYEYLISEKKEFGRARYSVVFHPIECDIKCNCLLFEFKGILCRHALMVLCRNDVKVIPEKYILKRWRKDVKRSHTRVSVNYGGWDSTPEQKRYDELCVLFSEITDEASLNERSTNSLKEWMSKYKLKMNSKEDKRTSSGPSRQAGHTVDCEDNAREDIRDPVLVKSKGRPREVRIKKKAYKRKKVSTTKMPSCEGGLKTQESSLGSQQNTNSTPEPMMPVLNTQQSSFGGSQQSSFGGSQQNTNSTPEPMMPVLDTQGSSLGESHQHTYYTPESRMSNMELLMGVYRPEFESGATVPFSANAADRQFYQTRTRFQLIDEPDNDFDFSTDDT